MRYVIPWRYETPQQCSKYYPHLRYTGLCPDLVVGNWRYITGELERAEPHGLYLPRWRRYLNNA